MFVTSFIPLLKILIILFIVTITGLFVSGNIYEINADQCTENVENICKEKFEGNMLNNKGSWGQCIEREMNNCTLEKQGQLLNLVIIVLPIIIILAVIGVIINKIKNKKNNSKS